MFIHVHVCVHDMVSVQGECSGNESEVCFIFEKKVIKAAEVFTEVLPLHTCTPMNAQCLNVCSQVLSQICKCSSELVKILNDPILLKIVRL